MADLNCKNKTGGFLKSISWSGDCLTILDQTLLPGKIEYFKCFNYRQVAEAIKNLRVRGAPAIGAAAAYGLVLGMKELYQKTHSQRFDDEFKTNLTAIATELSQTRPTAVNLFWAINRMLKTIENLKLPGEVSLAIAALEKEAAAISDEDKTANEQMAAYGAALFSEQVSILTHCNTGALATVAVGTALGVVFKAWEEGKIIRVFVDETRPLLQGARLTALELTQRGVPATLITDNTAGWVMKNKMVQAVIVGADRIALNGDAANKIGTYGLAVLAKEHSIPFYVAAPASTFDFSIKSGEDIVIEERDAVEHTHIGGNLTAPENIGVFNPAFDVTPNNLISAIVTEHGVLRQPYQDAIEDLRRKFLGSF